MTNSLSFSSSHVPGVLVSGLYAIRRYSVGNAGRTFWAAHLPNGDVVADNMKKYAAKDACSTHWNAEGCPAMHTTVDVSVFADADPDDSTPVLAPAVEVDPESDGEVLSRIQRSFRVMQRLVGKTIEGKYPSLIISGPGGIGKSYPTKAALRDCGKSYVEVSGKMTAVGLFKALWAVKDGGVLLIDDCDSVFEDNNALNLLKAALDSSDRRTISWLGMARWIEDDGMESQFDFTGSVIFITNIDFDAEIDRGTKRSAHLEALVSRSVLMDLDIKSTRDLLLRIQDMVLNVGMVDKFGLEDCQKEELVTFMKDNAPRFRSLTLREAVKLAKMIVADESVGGDEWRDEALATVAKGRRGGSRR